jgi:acyl carrier protein
MTSDPVLNKLSALLYKVLGEIGPITLDAKLVEDYDANSMDMVELADRAEDLFKINFPTEDLKTMTTVADVLAYVKAKLQEQCEPAAVPNI